MPNSLHLLPVAHNLDRRLVLLVLVACIVLELAVFLFGLVMGRLLQTSAAIMVLMAVVGVLAYPQLGFFFTVMLLFSALSANYFEGGFQIVVLLTIASLAISILAERIELIQDRLHTVVIIFGALVLLSLLQANSMKLALEGVADFFKAVVLYFLAANLIRSKHMFRAVFWAITIAASYVALFNLYQLAKDPTAFFTRVRWLFDDPNNLAMIFVTVIPIAYSLFRSEQSRILKLIALLICGVLSVAVIPTLSRTGLLAMGVVFLFILFKERKERLIFWSFIMMASILMIILIVKFSLGWEVISNRLTSLDRSFLQRYRLFWGALDMFAHHPLFGVGIGNFIVNSVHYTEMNRLLYAHNMYLHVACELGIAGVAAFVTLFIITIRRLFHVEKAAWKLRDRVLRYQCLGVKLSLIAMMIFGFFLSKQNNKILWILLGFGVAISQMVERENDAFGEARLG